MLTNSIKDPDREGLTAKKPADTSAVFSCEAELQLITWLDYEKKNGRYEFCPQLTINAESNRCCTGKGRRPSESEERNSKSQRNFTFSPP